MNSNLQEEIQQFLKTFEIHGPELAKCDWAGNPDFHLLKQARKLLVRVVNEPDRNLRERLYAFEQEFNSSDSDLKENIPSHYQGDVNMYLLDKAGKLIGDMIAWDKEHYI
jgi:hypothetical protein